MNYKQLDSYCGCNLLNLFGPSMKVSYIMQALTTRVSDELVSLDNLKLITHRVSYLRKQMKGRI